MQDTVFKDPLARLRYGPEFKYKWQAGEILRLDYNNEDKPLALRMPKEFVEEALQVVVTWDHDVTDGGFQVTPACFGFLFPVPVRLVLCVCHARDVEGLCGLQVSRIHLAKVEERKKLPRKIYKRPQWIVEPGLDPRRPPLPVNEEGCARATPYVRKSFSEKAEFTHVSSYLLASTHPGGIAAPQTQMIARINREG